MVAYRPGTQVHAAEAPHGVTQCESSNRRADIEAQTAGLTLCGLLERTAASHGDEPAYSDRDADGPWQTLTWREFREHVLRLAAGLVSLGLEPGDRVALMLPNRMEHVLADQAVLHAGGIPVTFYATLAPDQITYVASDCGVRLAVLDGASELARWAALAGRPAEPEGRDRAGRRELPR